MRPSDLLGDAQLRRCADEGALRRAGDDHDEQCQDIGRGVEEIVPWLTPTDCNAGPSAAAPPNSSDAHRHSIGFQRAKITSATAVMPCPLDRPSFQLPG